jgi:hypothetical protein
MIREVRERFNASFSQEKYDQFLQKINHAFHHTIPFRIAESPVFIDKKFKQKLLKASDEIIDFIVRPDFKKLTDKSIPQNSFVPNETDHTLFLALDFAVIKTSSHELEPRLIEMQGFPSLFGWQDYLANQFKEEFYSPPGFNNHFGFSSEEYKAFFKKNLLADHAPENVILLEIDPMKQNTAIDFLVTEKITGVSAVHIEDIIKEERSLFYKKDGRKILIERIYNRVIFDELMKRTDLKLSFSFTDELDVEWAGHPNWFFRISKFTMPFIKSEYIPECKFLSEYDTFPSDLENYVLKPLFSFSGTGVIFHVKESDLNSIPLQERSNFMLQRKVEYEPVIHAPDGMVKTEIRLLFIWEQGKPRPTLVTNLARLSRGEMIGVKYNKDKTWVGGSVCFFEE